MKEILTDEQLKKFQETETEIYDEFDKTTQIINLDEATMQSTEHYRAGIMITPNAKQYWHMYNFISYMLRLQSIRTLFIRIYGQGKTPEDKKKNGKLALEDYERRHIAQLSVYEKIATIQDKIDDLTATQMNKDLEKTPNLYLELHKQLAKTRPLNKDLFDLYHLINQYTSMGSRTVSSQAIQTMLKAQKKILTEDNTRRRENTISNI